MTNTTDRPSFTQLPRPIQAQALLAAVDHLGDSPEGYFVMKASPENERYVWPIVMEEIDDIVKIDGWEVVGYRGDVDTMIVTSSWDAQ